MDVDAPVLVAAFVVVRLVVRGVVVVPGEGVVVLADVVVAAARVAQDATVTPRLTAVEHTSPLQQPVYVVGCAAPATVKYEQGPARFAV